MTPSSARHGHRQSSSMNNLAATLGYSPVDLALDEDPRSSTELSDSVRITPIPRPATAPLSPWEPSRSLTKTRPSSAGRADHASEIDSDDDCSDADVRSSSGSSSSSDDNNNNSRPSHMRSTGRSSGHRSKPSSVNVVISNLTGDDSRQQHHLVHTPDDDPVSIGYGKVRFVLLVAGSLALFGNYYAFDNPAALNEPLREYMGMDTDTYAYFINLLYAVYSIPNIIMPWIGGYAADRFGHRKLLIVTSLTVALGHLVVCLGLTEKNIGTMYLGRVLFGAGETLAVTQAAITVKYFRGKELAMALGVNLCVLNDILTPIVWKSNGVVVAFWVGFVSCVVSCFSVFALVYVDRYYGGAPQTGGFQRLSVGRREDQHGMQEIARIDGSDSSTDSDSDQLSTALPSTIGKYDPPLQPSSLSQAEGPAHHGYQEDIAMKRLQKKEMLTEDIELEVEYDNGGSLLHTPTLSRSPMGLNKAKARLSWKKILLKLKELVDYNESFWVILLMIFVIIGVMVPFNSIHAGFLQMRWYHGDPQKAAQIMTVPDLLSSVLVLPFGFFVDYFGQKTWLFMITGLMIGIPHLTLGVFSPPSPIPALMALGVASAIGALFTSVIPALVKENQIAQAYGMTSSIINLAFTILPLIVAWLMTIDPTVYTYVEILFACCGFTGFILAIRLKWLDKDGTLDKREVVKRPVVIH
ncbi:hypothetical protein DFQ27_009375 [Actinomortierella ambigua]|uniref:Lysosomal dipeptide transporter MFSD1 n=1 Tax=Actinomortierella ambigua TaxID=1343610 RepID=A0A9P6PRG8_9FUNG|nr:hypothetical protein DFQ27_009375 [Actinomortierella ambigua]